MILEICSYDCYGRGVARFENKVYFVKNAQVGEVVKVKIVEENKKYNVAEVLKYLKKSDYRIKSPCPYYERCGGCHLGEMRYEKTLEFKEELIKSEFERNGIRDFSYLGIISGSPYYYRNKITLHSDGVRLGLYKEGSHDLVPIDKCLLVDEHINQIITTLPKDREVMVRISNISEDMLIGDEKKKIISAIGNRKYRISSSSFFQVNAEITKKLYDYIYEVVESLNSKNVLDLYCGIGTIGIYIHDLVEKVLGVEIVKEAVADANFNKKLNRLDHISFLCGDVSQYIERIKYQYDLIIVDPPRSGLKKLVVEEIKRLNAKTIIYISCNKATLIRDLKLLEERYRLQSLKLFDMFPNTYHVECVCVLNRR